MSLILDCGGWFNFCQHCSECHQAVVSLKPINKNIICPECRDRKKIIDFSQKIPENDPMIELNLAGAKHEQVHVFCDLDGVLARYETWDKQKNEIGPAIPQMVLNVKNWLSKGYKVTIFTARMSHSPEVAKASEAAIKEFLKENGLPELPITCVKHYSMTHLFDDKAWHVAKNSGVIDGLDANDLTIQE